MQFKYSPKVILFPILFVLILWVVFWFQVRINPGIKSFGIRPNDTFGFLGALTSPFLHGNISHLYNNTIPVFVLSMALFFFYPKLAWRVIVLGIVFSGILTWIIAKRGNHIGASGLIYVLFGFIFLKGILARHFRLVALSFLVVFLYGSMIWYVFPIKQGVSWEGHLSGLVVGFLFALYFRKQVAKPEKYVWEQHTYNEEEDPFMKHFDADGNFIEHPENDQESLKEDLMVNYIYKQKNPDDLTNADE